MRQANRLAVVLTPQLGFRAQDQQLRVIGALGDQRSELLQRLLVPAQLDQGTDVVGSHGRLSHSFRFLRR